MRLTVAQALVRFLAAQEVERDGVRGALLRRLLRHLRARQRRRARPGAAAAPRPARATTRRATSRRWSTSRPATRASATGSRRCACTTSVGPGATNMVTGAALATINRLPVLLLPGRHVRDPHAAPGAPAARGPARRDVSVNDCFRPVSRFFERVERARAARPRRARGDARAHRPGRDRRGHARAARGRAGRGVRLCPTAFLEPRVWTMYRRPPAPEALARAAELVRGARRPLIVAGGGVIYSEATAALRALRRGDRHPGGRDAGRPRRARLRPSAEPRRGRRDRHVGGEPRSPARPTSSSGSGRAGATSRPRRSRPSRTPTCASSTSTSRRSTRRKHSGLPLVADARVALDALREALAGHRADAGLERARRRGGGRLGRRGRAPRRGRATARTPLPAQAAVIGAVNDAAGETGVVVCAAGLDARRPAQAVARPRPRGQGLPRRVRLLVHGLRDPGRHGRQARRARARGLRPGRRRLVPDAAGRARHRGGRAASRS